MKNKINYIYHINNLTHNDQAVKEIMENMEKTETFENIINQDIVNQEDSFRIRLEKKRRKNKKATDEPLSSERLQEEEDTDKIERNVKDNDFNLDLRNDENEDKMESGKLSY